MTCIVGIEHKGKVWMGGDSAGTNSMMNQTIRDDKKVFINGDFIIGFCGSFRMGQLLNYTLKPPVHPEGKSDMEYMVGDFMNAVKMCLDVGEEGLEPNFLCGYRGKLYEIEGDYQVGIPQKGFAAIGSGGDLATGSIMSSKGNPKKRILVALKAAESGNAAVRAPFIVLNK